VASKRRPAPHIRSVTAVSAAVQTSDQTLPSDGILDGRLRRFQVVPALTDELRDEAFRIRHVVFCEELSLFDRRPDRRETDEFDERAVQLLLRHTPTNEFIGCVRVVKGLQGDRSALLPFESVCRHLVDKALLDLDTLPRHLLGEVSRLGVIGKFRRRKGEDKSPIPYASDDDIDSATTPERRQFPHILVALYLGAYAIAQRENIEHLCTFTELRLLNHLVKLGLPVSIIGASIQHKGLRVPAVLNVSRIAAMLNPSVQAIYGRIVLDLDSALK
jgi:N-acyl amino acid synthase of PEP-CTERM/exosortase system